MFVKFDHNGDGAASRAAGPSYVFGCCPRSTAGACVSARASSEMGRPLSCSWLYTCRRAGLR